ncbi:hypothetical protein GOV07_05410 [Candidatus Woesearchaeota archaeon]|nr:hypothetical protein [Candidatus Woesearchaeota archaeon]
MNKRGMELAVNTLVVLILGIVLLGSALTLVYKVYDKAIVLPDEMNQQTEQQLFDMLLSSKQKVAVLENVKNAQRKTMAVYAVAFQNHLDGADHTFTVEVALNAPPDEVDCGSPVNYALCPEPNFLDVDYTLKRYDSKAVYVGLDVPKEAKSGEYIYSVNIMDDGGNLYGRTKIHVNVK